MRKLYQKWEKIVEFIVQETQVDFIITQIIP